MINFFRRILGIKVLGSLAELRRYIKKGDVRGLANWIEWRIDYAYDKTDGSEEWLPADFTIRRGKGDCEDKAVVAWEVIRMWPGWTPQLVVLTKEDKAHAVCVFEAPNGERGVIDGTAIMFPHKTAWGWIFDCIGGWKESYWVDNKGRIL